VRVDCSPPCAVRIKGQDSLTGAKGARCDESGESERVEGSVNARGGWSREEDEDEDDEQKTTMLGVGRVE